MSNIDKNYSKEDFSFWNGSYEKEFYDVKLPSGEIVLCYPNAGIMNAVDGSDRKWYADDPIMVKIVYDAWERIK